MVKHCKHGTCKSDDRFLDRESAPVNFFVFPKPCKDFKLLEKDPTLKIEHCESTCETCSKCHQWINSCGLVGFTKLSQLSQTLYICSKHFVDGKPSENHPVPVSANKSQVSFLFRHYYLVPLIVPQKGDLFSI